MAYLADLVRELLVPSAVQRFCATEGENLLCHFIPELLASVISLPCFILSPLLGLVIRTPAGCWPLSEALHGDFREQPDLLII